MAKEEWFRKKKWSEEDEKEFFTRLNRSKTIYNKSQYLRIQADCLVNEYPKTALELIEILLRKYPDKSQFHLAYSTQARCNKILGEKEKVVASYHKSFEARRNYPNFKSYSHFEFGVWVINEQLIEYYDEIYNLIEEFDEQQQIFSQPLFYKNGICAIINYQRGNISQAKYEASNAILIAKETKKTS